MSILSGCSWLFPAKDSTDYLHNLKGYPSVNYDINFKIEGDESIKSFVETNSKLFLLKSKPPISSNALRYRALQDIKNIRRALKHKGYFDVKVKAKIGIRMDLKQVEVTIQTGTQYKIGGFSLEITDHSPEVQLTPSKLGRVITIEIGDIVDQDKIFSANLYLEKYFKDHGYPFVKLQIPDGKLNKDKKELSVIFKVQLNHLRHNGSSTITGLKTVSPQYVKNRIVWQKGDVYDEREVERTKRKLIASELFSSVIIQPIDTFEEGNLPLNIEVVEAPPRLIGAGIEYTSSKGPGGRLIWAHHNLFGAGETFTIEGKGNQKESKAIMSYEIPDVLIPDLSFITWLSARYDNTRAYKGVVYDSYMGFNWGLEHFRTSAGLEYERSKLTRILTQRENYFSIPLTVLWDARNDVINPYKGWRLLTEITPYFGNLGKSNKMLRVLGNASYYLRLIKKDIFVVGVWGRVGEINRIKNDDIPLDKRFYSGGLNSVRGYGYQKIGPIDTDGNPKGGKNLVEFGIEPRFKITETIGTVFFIEAGSVGKKRRLNLQEKPYLIGYGIGARYYTAIGPIRFDVAFPAKKRTFNGTRYDAPFQLYISIGQAF